MPTSLLAVHWPSSYVVNGAPVALPKRMAFATPDMKASMEAVAPLLAQKGGRLVLSDLFRSYDMQFQAHLDYVTGKKTAFSPPPGGSLHEAGRAFDLDLGALKISLKDFWTLAAGCGLTPIIDQPISGKDESWHFECRGSHQLVYDYYKSEFGKNFDKPYKAMAASAILAVGVKVDVFDDKQQEAYIQSGLIRLGQRLGNMDGAIGPNTRKALSAVGISPGPTAKMVDQIDHLLQAKFPGEFFVANLDPAAHALT